MHPTFEQKARAYHDGVPSRNTHLQRLQQRQVEGWLLQWQNLPNPLYAPPCSNKKIQAWHKIMNDTAKNTSVLESCSADGRLATLQQLSEQLEASGKPMEA